MLGLLVERLVTIWLQLCCRCRLAPAPPDAAGQHGAHCQEASARDANKGEYHCKVLRGHHKVLLLVKRPEGGRSPRRCRRRRCTRSHRAHAVSTARSSLALAHALRHRKRIALACCVSAAAVTPNEGHVVPAGVARGPCATSRPFTSRRCWAGLVIGAEAGHGEHLAGGRYQSFALRCFCCQWKSEERCQAGDGGERSAHLARDAGCFGSDFG
mmetsp:Transcript_11560/g.24336  ORF Transcript_11560/g.24336 Transcript_11560/m.24336 type:complete len:213 (-) Transcript_11560:51-689(-)